MNYAAMRYLTEGGCPVEGAAWQVVAVIAWHADKTTGDSYLSRRNIAKETRLSTGTVHAVLADLVNRGILEIVITGTGRRAMTYRVAVPCVPLSQSASGSTTEPQPQTVVAQSTDRSGSVDPTVVAQLAGPYIGGREEQEGFEGRASAAPPTGGATRFDKPATTTVPDWRAALNSTSPNGSVAPPVSAAAADARQAAPDEAASAARPTTRRPSRGGRRTRHRGREPPAACNHRSHHSVSAGRPCRDG